MTDHELRRPQTLADVAEIARQNSSDFAMALDELVDEFYLYHPDKIAQQKHLDAVPSCVDDPQRWGLKVPNWTKRSFDFALQKPVFLLANIALRGIVIVESPPAFRSRLIFTRAEPLARARFPSDA